MKHTCRWMALLVCLMLLLTACGAEGRDARGDSAARERHSRTEESAEETAAPAATPAPTATPAPAATPAVTEEPQPYTEPPVTSAPEVVEVQVHYGETTEIEHVEFTGMSADGQELWKRIFTTEYRTELTLIQPIGLWQDRYYLNHNGTVVCLNLADGTTKWENDEFHGASISSLIDKGNGNVYLCGYYGPDFFACDAEGNTLASLPTVSSDYYWPTNMQWAGPDRLVIYFTGGMDSYTDPDVPYYIDLTDFSATYETDFLDLSGDRQYWANIFISDFVEQFMSEYPAENGSDYELARFAHRFCKINRHDAISYESGGDAITYETISLDTVNELCRRFFGLELDPGEGVLPTELWGPDVRFENGKFYFPAADGEAYNRFAVVTSAQSQPGGNVLLSFDVYEVNLNEYWSQGIDSAFYRMTSAEAQIVAAEGRITCVSSGTALTTPVVQNGHDGYILHSLYIDLT